MSKNDFTVLESRLFIRLLLGFVRKMFLPIKCVFISVIFCNFHVNVEEELNQQVCVIKYVENEISNTTSCKKKERGAKR